MAPLGPEVKSQKCNLDDGLLQGFGGTLHLLLDRVVLFVQPNGTSTSEKKEANENGISL